MWRIVFAIGVKALLDGEFDREAVRERNRQRVVTELARQLKARQSAGTAREA